MNKFVFSAILVSVLAGCGGGGGDPSPEGYWRGVASPGWYVRNGGEVSLLVLENGETWAVYESTFPPATNLIPSGGIHGTTTSSGNSFGGAGVEIAFASRALTWWDPVTYSGTVSGRSSISLTTSTGIKIDASYQPEYDEPASLAAVAGTFEGYGSTHIEPRHISSITVDAGGAVTVPYDLFCGGSGSLAPRPSGKNVFDVTLTLGTMCDLGGLHRFTGTAYYETATRRLVLLAFTPNRARGFMYVARKK